MTMMPSSWPGRRRRSQSMQTSGTPQVIARSHRAPVLRRAWNADVSSSRTASITTHTGWSSGRRSMSGGSRNP